MARNVNIIAFYSHPPLLRIAKYRERKNDRIIFAGIPQYIAIYLEQKWQNCFCRHTPVFRPQKLTVPSMSDREQVLLVLKTFKHGRIRWLIFPGNTFKDERIWWSIFKEKGHDDQFSKMKRYDDQFSKRNDMMVNFQLGQMENRQATVVDHKLESRPQEGGKRKVIVL